MIDFNYMNEEAKSPYNIISDLNFYISVCILVPIITHIFSFIVLIFKILYLINILFL